MARCFETWNTFTCVVVSGLTLGCLRATRYRRRCRRRRHPPRSTFQKWTAPITAKVTYMRCLLVICVPPARVRLGSSIMRLAFGCFIPRPDYNIVKQTLHLPCSCEYSALVAFHITSSSVLFYWYFMNIIVFLDDWCKSLKTNPRSISASLFDAIYTAHLFCLYHVGWNYYIIL